MKNKKAFTLIELLVVIAIIGVLATISVIALSNARAKARDSKRAGNVKQIQTALEMFYNDKGRYPTEEEWLTGKIFSTTTNSTTTYMQIIPTAPTPIDGSCTDNQNTFSYTQTQGGNFYTISFCLGGRTGTLTSGPKCLTPGGIIDVDCSPAEAPSYLLRSYVYGTDSMDDWYNEEKLASDGTYIYGVASGGDISDEYNIISKYNKADMSLAARKKISSVANIWNLVTDSSYLYLVGRTFEGPGTSNALVLKLDKDDLSVLDSLIFGDVEESLMGVVSDGSYLYAVGASKKENSQLDGILAKISKASLDLDSVVYYGINDGVPEVKEDFISIDFDDSYLYVGGAIGGAVQSGLIVKYNKSDLSVAGRVTFGDCNDTTRFVVVDDSYLYAFGALGSGEPSLIKYNKSDLSIAAKITMGDLNYTPVNLSEYGSYLYVLLNTSIEGAGERDVVLLKVNKSDLSLVEADVYGNDEYNSGGGIIADADGIYFSASDYSTTLWYTRSAPIHLSDLVSSTYNTTPSGWTLAPSSITFGSNSDSAGTDSAPSAVASFTVGTSAYTDAAFSTPGTAYTISQ